MAIKVIFQTTPDDLARVK